MNQLKVKQQGVILFVVLMVMLLMSILVMMAVQTSKNNAKISLAQAQQVESFDNAEAMLSRVQFALGQLYLEPGTSDEGVPDNDESIIWRTEKIAQKLNKGTGTSGVNDPLFAQPEFEWNTLDSASASDAKTLTCGELQSWLIKNGSVVDLECSSVFPNAEQQPRILIESLVDRRGTIGDMDQSDKQPQPGSSIYRITILGQGYHSGRNIVQGTIGVSYK